MIRKYPWAAVAALLLWFGAPSARAAENIVKAVFAYGAINAYMTTTWVAREQGFFRKQNIGVEPVFIIASRAAQAMLAGEVHVGLIGPTHVTNAVAAGGDLVMFMGNQNKVRYLLVADQSIKRSEDLRGKRIAIGASQAGLASLAAYAVLDHLGLNPRRDNIALLLTGEEPLRLAALQSGNVQATIVAPEMANAAVGRGFDILVDMGKLKMPFQASGMVTTRKLLRSDPRLIERIGRATLESIDFIRKPANRNSVLQVMAGNLKLAKAKVLEDSYNDLVEELPRNICPSVQGVKSVMRLMADLGLNPKAAQLKPEDVIDLTICTRLGGDGEAS